MEFQVKYALRKYFIMGSQNCNQNPVGVLEAAAKAGITAFQFREKGHSSLTDHAKIELGMQLRAICKSYDIPFFVNDDIELVDLLDADGIHVGQEDHSVKMLRKHFPNKVIGLSVSTPEELTNSPIELVDYIGAGPVFHTTSKADAKSIVGLEWIEELRTQFPTLPIVGIGGINTTNARSVLAAGADGISFISAITEAENIEEALEAM